MIGAIVQHSHIIISYVVHHDLAVLLVLHTEEKLFTRITDEILDTAKQCDASIAKDKKFALLLIERERERVMDHLQDTSSTWVFPSEPQFLH